jgi:ribose transport system ATP-binding protein
MTLIKAMSPANALKLPWSGSNQKIVVTKKITGGGSMSKHNDLLELKDITKIYPGVVALNQVSISFKKGEVHAIIGENGAGKSTLIKIITGAVKPSEGEIIYNGHTYQWFNPIQAVKLGIGAVYQEFNLIPYLSIAENIFFGREFHHGPFCDLQKMNQKTEQILAMLGEKIGPRTKVKDLSVAYQQIVEIAKVISREVRVLILDEPTAPLTANETKVLFNIVKRLKEQGVLVIYISHRLEEIFEIADRVTVLRDSQYIATIATKDTDRQKLIALMVGRELTDSFPSGSNDHRQKVLEVNGLTTGYLHQISFQVNKGEILGFAGLVGAGRTETARALFGADPVLSGSIVLNGVSIRIRSPQDAIRHGIVLIPEDRKQQGLLLKMTIKDNISLGCLQTIAKCGWINPRKELKMVNGLQKNLQIKTPSLQQLVKNLSGGNQQKVVLAKWLAINCEVIIFDEPTRGIDVGAKQEIYKLIRDLAANGKAIIIISSEMPEVLGMSDRIAIMHEGEIVKIIDKSDATQELILDLASGC